VHTEIDEVRTAVTARHLAADAGRTPREQTLGSSVRHPPRRAPPGHRRLRRASSFPALVAMRQNPNPAVHALAQRLRSRGTRPLVSVGAAMRTLLPLSSGGLTSGKPVDPALALAA
jgi:transposase